MSENDDFNFWSTFFEVWNKDFILFQSDKIKKHEIFVELGACSHWLRPHQYRLTAAGGFAVPIGYLEGGQYGDGLPEFDWSVLIHWNKEKSDWSFVTKYFGKKKLVCRIALPTRTLKHKQAVGNVLWRSGTPQNPAGKSKSYYAFRNVDGNWICAATGEI